MPPAWRWSRRRFASPQLKEYYNPPFLMEKKKNNNPPKKKKPQKNCWPIRGRLGGVHQETAMSPVARRHGRLEQGERESVPCWTRLKSNSAQVWPVQFSLRLWAYRRTLSLFRSVHVTRINNEIEWKRRYECCFWSVILFISSIVKAKPDRFTLKNANCLH